MIKKQKNGIQYLQFNNLLNIKDIKHFSTTRIGGISEGKLESLNTGYTVNDNPKNVTANLDSLAKTIGITRSQFVSPKQTHSKNIGIVNSTTDLFPNTDALITNKKDICIFVRTADCVPILLFDPVQKAAAAIHSGWKSTIQEISMHTIQLMQKEFGSKAKDIIAGIGPSIGPKVYEVGPELVKQFSERYGQEHISKIPNSDKGLLNLWSVNKQILIESGIPEKQVEVAEICTFSNPELFYSARRDGVKTGRLATGIIIK